MNITVRRARRGALALVAGVGLALVPALSASAHVSVSSTDAAPGGFGKITFRVPSESETANTTSLTVQLPADTPFPFVNVEAVPGWTAETTTAPLAEPIEVEGFTVTEAVTSVTWTAEGEGLAPNQFSEFAISAGPFPDVDELSFPATQTYSDGEVVEWNEPTPESGEEPERPAPVLALGATSTDDGSDSTDTVARVLGVLGLGLGVIAIVLAVAGTAIVSPSGMSRFRGLVVAVVVLLALGAGGTARVSAHAALESSTPANGAVLDTAPTVVELVFSENVGNPAALSVLGPDGDELAVGDLSVVDDTMRRNVDGGGAGAGTYTISYQVTSADGHPVSGSLGFSVGGVGGTPASGAPTVTPADPTDASPIVVAGLGAVLAVALGVALAATRRLIVAGTEPDPAP